MPPRRSVVGVDTPAYLASSSSEDSHPAKNKPKPSRLRQQKLPAWQPILTAYTAIPVIFLVGVIFIPLGIVLLIAADSVKEWEYPYESCNASICTMDINLKEDYNGNVYFYYGLENYFQNHRRYVKSRSDRQLAGDLKQPGECAPYDFINGSKIIAPCGAIANSMFNDSFVIRDTKTNKVVPMTHEGVIWEVDRDVKFKNPTKKDGQTLCDAFSETEKPPNWNKRICELDPSNDSNNGFQNVDFIVWMRTAALPSFRKLYRLLDRNVDATYMNGLPKGVYRLEIANNYPVRMFNGKKSFIISTTSWTGGHNKFLGVAYIVIGSICIVFGAIFTVIHLKFGHSFAEMADITTTTH